MNNREDNHRIQLMEYLSEQEYKEINELQNLCREYDPTNLKLELDYKLFVGNSSSKPSGKANEFLYYAGTTLVSYLGISCFGGNIGELNGLTHPSFRHQGIFQKLFEQAVVECRTRGFSKILLLTDHRSSSGTDFIKAAGGSYDFSEYRMKLNTGFTKDLSLAAGITPVLNPDSSLASILLREATKEDQREIRHQNALIFNDIEQEEDSPSEENPPNMHTYLIELEGTIIGKINVEYGEDHTFAFIFGFGIHPNYRGKGYGRAALSQTLQIIRAKGAVDVQLDVVCTNSNALGLYQSCGFEEQSVMDYYQYKI